MNLKALIPKKREISDYDIEMLNVKAADAFIIRFKYVGEKKYHIILVDAGNVGDGDTILNHIRKFNDNPVIDLAIVTHPDADHFGGYITMLKHIKDHDDIAIPIHRFWINNPQKSHINVDDVKYVRTQKGVNERAASIWDINDNNLVKLIEGCGIPSDEVFARTKWIINDGVIEVKTISEDPVFPGCTIIGPTKKYFEELAPNLRFDNMKFFSEEAQPKDEDEVEFEPSDECLSKVLDEANDDGSAHNQSSLIFLWEPKQGEKFLFMGDAGYAAFQHIKPIHKKMIKGVTWLKVPHHGSMHNLNTEMIKHIAPHTAYISTESRGHYLSQCTVNALKNAGVNVYSTHHKGHNILHGHRDGYKTEEKL